MGDGAGRHSDRIKFRADPGVPYYVRRELERALHELPQLIELRHRFTVRAVKEQAVKCDSGLIAFAVFTAPDAPPADFRLRIPICVAAGLAGIVRSAYRQPPAVAAFAVAEGLIHEFVHYEQWRDGRRIIETGVNQRARSLVRKIIARQGRTRLLDQYPDRYVCNTENAIAVRAA